MHRGALRASREARTTSAICGAGWDLADSETLAAIEARMIDGGIASKDWPTLAARLRQAAQGTQSLPISAHAGGEACAQSRLHRRLSFGLFTQKGAPRGGDGTILTNGLCKKDPELLVLLEQERERLAALIAKRKTAATFARSLALAQIGEAIVSCYERMKNHRGLFDFDDLIERTRELLRRSSPSWGALPTRPADRSYSCSTRRRIRAAPQWRFYKSSPMEFAQATRPRSFFAVGDEKAVEFSPSRARRRRSSRPCGVVSRIASRRRGSRSRMFA